MTSRAATEIDGIYYDLDFSTMTAEVTPCSNKYTGSVIIPPEVISDGITYSVTSIGDGAFDGCSSLTAIIIPNSVTCIGNFAFCGCRGLTSINIPKSVTSIGNNAFHDCRGLTSITIPSSVTSIGDAAFWGCSSLTAIQVDAANNVYDSRNSCNAIIETATNTLVAGCKNTIIPSSVTSIGIVAFAGCSSLTAINIPASVTTIGHNSFSGCSSLTDCYCYAEEVPVIHTLTFENSNISNAALHVPAGSVAAYQSAPLWSNFKEIIAIESDDDLPTYDDLLAMTTDISFMVRYLSDHCSEVAGGLSSISFFLPSSEKTQWEAALTNAAELLSRKQARIEALRETLREATPSEYSSIRRALEVLDIELDEILAAIEDTENSIVDYAKGDIGRRTEEYRSYIIDKCYNNYEEVSRYVNTLFGEDYFQRTASGDNEKYVTSLKNSLEEIPSKIKEAHYYVEETDRLTIESFEDVVSGYKLIDSIENLIQIINKDCFGIRHDADYFATSMPLIFPDEKKFYKIVPRDIGGNVSIGYQTGNGFVLSENGKITFEQVDDATFYLKDAYGHYLVALNDTRELIVGSKDEATLWKGSAQGNGTYWIEQNTYPPYLSYCESDEGFALQLSYGSCRWTITEWNEAENYKSWTIGTNGDFASINAAMSDSRVKDDDVLQVMKSNTAITGTQTVTKAVTIQGNGYESLNDGWLNGDLYVNCTGVTLKGLYVSGDIYLRDEKATIERCRVTSIKTPNNYDSDNATIRGCLITGTVGGNSSNSAYYWNVYNNIILGTVAYIEESTFNHNAIVSAADGIVLLEPIVHDVIGSSFTNNIVFASNKQTVFSDNTLNSVTKFEYNIHSNSSNPSGFATNIYGYETIGKLFTCTGKEGTDAYYQTASGSPAIGYANDGGDCGPWSGSFPYKLNGIDEASEGGGGTTTDDQLVEPNDLLALKNLYQAFGGSGWTTKKWSFENNGSKLEDFPGVTFDANGRVTAIDLQDNGLVGECFQVSSPQLSELTSLNLSRNKISGDLGKLVGQLAKLTKLDMSYNRLTKTDGVMAFSEGFSSNINVRYQNRVYQSSSSTTSAFTDNVATMAAPTITIGQTMKIDIPSLYTYDYKYGEHRLNPPFKVREPGTPSTNMAQLVYNGSSNYTNGSTYRFSYSGLYLKPQDQRVVLVDEWSNYACYSAFPVTLHYEEGDADMTGETNVLDVQYTLNFILAPNSQSRFNWSAADTYTDMNINVQDIVQTVNIILGLPRHPNYASRMAEDGGESEATDGYVYARQGSIMLTAERNVAAIDIDLEGVSTSEVALMLNRRDFQMIGRNTEWGSRYMIFSPTGKSIPAGTTAQLLRMSGAGEPMSVECSDPDAQPVWLSVGSAPTGIGEAVATAASDSNTYNLSGQRVEKPRKGIYLQQGRKVVVK